MKLFGTIRRRWKQHQRQKRRNSAFHHRQVAQSQPTGSYQVDASGGVSYQPGPTNTVGGGQAKLPPPDGTMANCRRCSNEVQYNGDRERWEHTGKGHAECFQRRRG